MPDYAVYGVHFYGTALYGLPPTFEFTLNYFDAYPVGYDRIKVEWTHPTGDWDVLRLVRGNYGFPTEYDDGRLVTEATNVYPSDHPNAGSPMVPGLPTNPGTYEDTNVSELRFHYYTLWLHQIEGDIWRRAGNVVALMPKNFGYTDRLYELVPGVFRDEDIFISQTSGVGMLQTFLSVFGYELDKMRSDIESLRWTSNPERVAGGLLPYLADQLGFPYEAELGMTLARQQILNAVYLYKMKGSRLGLEGFVKVMTGWEPEVSSPGPGAVEIILRGDRVNQIENPSAEVDNSLWVGTNATVAQDMTLPRYGAASFRLTVTANGDASMQTPAGTAGMPVTPGRLYSGAIEIRKNTGTARQLRTDIIWYDDAGDPLGAPVLGEEAAQVLGTWMRPSVTAAAPTGAATAALRATVIDGGAGENQFLDGAMFGPGAVGPYFDASVGEPIADYLWEGTIGLSPSHYYYRRAIKNSRLVTRLPEFLPAGTAFTLLYGEPL